MGKRKTGLMESAIQGIPCQIDVTTCIVVKGSYSYNAPSDLDYYGFTEIEFDVYDRKGYPAAWLERKMTDDDRRRIEGEIMDNSQLEDDYEMYHDYHDDY